MNYIIFVKNQTNMGRTKKSKWYEVRYFENGVWHQEFNKGRREAREIHKRYPGSIYREIILN